MDTKTSSVNPVEDQAKEKADTSSDQPPSPEHSSPATTDKDEQKTSDQSSLPSSLSASAPAFESTSSSKSGTTQLSALAQEFVPKSYQPVTADYIQQPYQGGYQEGSNAGQYGEGDFDPKTDPLMEYSFQVLYDITCNPGHFTRLCEQLVSTLNSWRTLDDGFLPALVDEIVSQAIREPNFRYNGARLCNAISRQLHVTDTVGTDFRTTLLNHCKVTHDDRKNLVQSEAEYLRGFALFMSELFLHMSPKSNASARFALLGRAVRELLQTLLQQPTPANIKCLCQILKLSGSHIEDDDRQTHGGKAVDMDALMTNIDTVARTVDMQMHIKDLLRSMIELRASDWGRASTSPVPPVRETAHPPPVPQMGQSHLGVFYGPDGQVLTPEETEFLNQGMNRHEEEEEFDYPEDEDTGMDDEMVEAFEKFLMMQDALK